MFKLSFLLGLVIFMNGAFGQLNQTISAPEIIGITDIAVQSNRCNPGRLIYEWPNGTMAAVWVQATNYPTFSDRGTGYNFFNGSSWNPVPTGRLESMRTNFPNIIGKTTNGEFIFSHTGIELYKLYRNVQGIGPWSQSQQLSIPQLFPRFATGGPNNQILHLLTINAPFPTNNQFNELKYWRSQDFGNTWDIQNYNIPQLNATQLLNTSPDSKNISSRDSIVAIVIGGFTDNLLLCKSTDNGNSWTTTVINQFPIPLYDEYTMMTDLNLDGIADDIITVDQSASLVIDSHGMVHVWVGRMRVRDDDIPNLCGIYPFDSGLVYWNESMGPNTILNNLIADIEDIDSDGIINIVNYNSFYSSCRCNASGMPSAGINITDDLFVAYSAFVEDTINPYPSPLKSVRNIYLMSSSDYGQTWSTPFRIFPQAGGNQYSPSMAEKVLTNPRIIFFQDTTDGMSFEYQPKAVIYCSPGVVTSTPINNADPSFYLNAYKSSNSGLITIVLQGALNEEVFDLTINDRVGKLVGSFKIVAHETKEQKEFYVGPLPEGIYMVNINSKRLTKTLKLFYSD